MLQGYIAFTFQIFQNLRVLCFKDCRKSKGGIAPSDAAEFCLSLARFPHIEQVGFMTMGPKFEKKADYENYFLETYQLVLDIWREKLHNIKEPVISMGMSDSYETAIKCGANCVRVGRALFGR